MTGHMIDQFIFRSRRLQDRGKNIAFGIIVFILFATFWWFKGVAFGIEGPAQEHWGLKWRKVCCNFLNLPLLLLTSIHRAGISTSQFSRRFKTLIERTFLFFCERY